MYFVQKTDVERMHDFPKIEINPYFPKINNFLTNSGDICIILKYLNLKWCNPQIKQIFYVGHLKICGSNCIG